MLRHPLTKVPEITIFFWIIKILTTAMGESTSDYLVNHFNPIIAVMATGIIFLGVLALQFSVKRYVTLVYWLNVVMVAIFGTMAADIVHIGLGIPYLVSTIFFGVALGIIFVLWYATEKTLSIHSIYTKRREIFYWATVLCTFALGTAAGDMTASTFGLGYLSSGILFAILIVLVILGHYLIKIFLASEHRRETANAVLAFWLAYVLTRPLGASFADWMGKAQGAGGLGWGDGTVSLILAILILFFVGYMALSKKDVRSE